MPIDINAFNRDPQVQGFGQYLEAVIRGDEPIGHSYLDRNLDRLRSDNRNGLNPQRHFQTLEDAFAGYYWPAPKDSYDVNRHVLAILSADLQAAWDAENEADLRASIEAILWWGSGNGRSRLYTANKSWIDIQMARDVTVAELLRRADAAFSASPEFNENVFQAATLRSNAGFTKVYSLLFDDFIMYDSRVAAALGLLVTRYLEAQQAPENRLPGYLNFARMNAAGADNRNASSGAWRFWFAGTHALHARSNWVANQVLKQAVDSLFAKSLEPTWIDSRAGALRRIEAALFMLGKHVPQIGERKGQVV